MTMIHSNLVDGLREGGYAVDLDASGMSACASAGLVDRAADFVDSALTVAGSPTSGRAYIRFSCARERLFVEVTHLGCGTFNALLREDAAVTALEQLRAWAAMSGRSLTVDRGPRDQLRIAATFEPNPTALAT
jgi:hypothetical protein